MLSYGNTLPNQLMRQSKYFCWWVCNIKDICMLQWLYSIEKN